VDDGGADLHRVAVDRKTVTMLDLTSLHGGPDAQGVPRWDFSTCANAAAPDGALRARIAAADAGQYPDPTYRALRERLAARHGVNAARVLPGASASELIQRLASVVARLVRGPVAIPAMAYADYARAAAAQGLQTTTRDDAHAVLRWACEPSSPSGGDEPPLPADRHVLTVLDAVYEPLRLHGDSTWPPEWHDAVFVLHGPNKVLGLPGVRGAYLIAPAAARWQPWVSALQAAAPSWPWGVHAVAMLEAWCEPTTQSAIQRQLETLRDWKRRFVHMLRNADVECRDSTTPFFLMRLPRRITFDGLRAQGCKLRDTASFGLPGWARVNTLAPPAQAALVEALAKGAA
jgi:histidinol-phosphate aminotransferase